MTKKSELVESQYDERNGNCLRALTCFMFTSCPRVAGMVPVNEENVTEKDSSVLMAPTKSKIGPDKPGLVSIQCSRMAERSEWIHVRRFIWPTNEESCLLNVPGIPAMYERSPERNASDR